MLKKSLLRVVAFTTIVLVQPTGVHADGLPGEYLLSTRWRDLMAAHSPLSNPAFLTEKNYISFRLALAPIMQRAFRLTEIGGTVPIGMYQSVGVTFIGEFDGEVVEGVEGPGGRLEPGTNTTSNTNEYWLLSYAINPWNRLSLGVNVAWAYQTNFGEPVSGVGLDLGISYRAINHPLFGDHLVGISTVNLIAPSMNEGIVPKFSNEGEYSRDLKVTWLGTFLEKQIEAGLDIHIKDFLASAGEFAGRFDSASGNWSSLSKSIEWDMNLRVGGWLLRLFQAYLQLGFDEQTGVVDYWGIAAGMKAPSFNNGRDLSVLFQYSLKSAGEKASAFTWYAFFDVGKHREELLARRLARLSDLSPNELYNRAMNLFSQGKYWDAFYIYSQILSQFPEFFKNDWVHHYRARCQEELDMREVAESGFKGMVGAYPRSDAVPHSDLGMMRIFYRDAKTGLVEEQFNKLSRPTVPDSLRYHASYLMAETHLHNGDYRKAIQFFSSIPATHPEYVFAQHSMAVAHVLADDPIPVVTQALGNCIEHKPKTKAEQEVVSRSYVFFGYMFYEESMLSKSVVALRKVPANSYYYSDAQLGLAWSAIRARQWTDCVASAKELQAKTKDILLQSEGLLCESYAYMMQKNYAQSLTCLQDATKKLARYRVPSPDDLSSRTWAYENTRISYQFLAENAEDLSLKAPSEYMMRQVDSLHIEQNGFKDTIDHYLGFRDEFARRSFFARSHQKIKDDVSYALVNVQKLLMQSGTSKDQEQLQTQQQQLEEEIEKIKEEMRRMEEEEGSKRQTPPQGGAEETVPSPTDTAEEE